MRFFPSDRAVNPVVGTILMVGIVVILSAAIGTFIIGLGGTMTGDATSAVDIEDLTTGTDGSVTVGVTSLYNADHINVTVTVESGGDITHNSETGPELATHLNATGDTATFTEDTSGETTIRILAVAVGGDHEQIVMDREETI